MDACLSHKFLLAAVLAWAAAGCTTLSTAQREQAAGIAVAARSGLLDCGRSDACALPSPLTAVAERARLASSGQDPHHYAQLLEEGPTALMARVHLIRSARRAIDVQTYIFDEDDAGQLVLDELLAAARRGVQVRLLVDQIAAFRQVETQARLASSHRNFALRLYNPTGQRGRARWRNFLATAACCFRALNQRLHSKLLVIDGAIAISGGRNYQDDYYDWDAGFNFRDRDLLLAGPAVADMQAHFDAFWQSPRSVPAERLDDVGRLLLRDGAPPPTLPRFARPERAAALVHDATEDTRMASTLAASMMPVGKVRFVGDTPDKHRLPAAPSPSTDAIHAALGAAREEVLLQTPYLVLSPGLQAVFGDLQQRPSPPRVQVSTNSLASTDNPPAYALAYRTRHLLTGELMLQLHEYKPFPADAPIDVASTGAVEPTAALSALVLHFVPPAPLPPPSLREAGVRTGLHAKALVIDGKVGLLGSSNFDGRGEHYNVESVVIVEDPTFAAALAASIRRDMAPDNAWQVRAPCGQPARCNDRAGTLPETGVVRRMLTRVLARLGAGLAPLL